MTVTKSEIRIPKSERSPNAEIRMTKLGASTGSCLVPVCRNSPIGDLLSFGLWNSFGFRPSDFGFLSDFGFRISDLIRPPSLPTKP
jgi:hypothetical protein